MMTFSPNNSLAGDYLDWSYPFEVHKEIKDTQQRGKSISYFDYSQIQIRRMMKLNFMTKNVATFD